MSDRVSENGSVDLRGEGAGLPLLIDPFDRRVSYLRVSVTDRCDFRCVYCMAESMTFLPKAEVLTLEELDRLCSAFVRRGVRKLRLTGGEPLVRRNILWLFERLGRHLDDGTLDELTLTTNGSQLGRFADDLYAAGVRRINVSIDTLDSAKFAEITRWGRLEQVMDGLAAADAAGLRVKINAVALRGVNDDELTDMVEWCGGRGYDLTFIEVMPLRRDRRRREARPVSAAVDGARRAQAPLHAGRERLFDRRAGALHNLPGDRRAGRVHHPDDPQFLRILQPRPPDLHRHALYVPRPGGRRRPPRPAARER